MPDATVRAATRADLPHILELMSASLGDGMPRIPAFTLWKHFDNPSGRSLMLVAEDDEGMVGFRAMMRWSFRCEGREIQAVRPVDTATHPRFRRRGLFTRLTKLVLAQLADEGVSMVFNTPNDKSRPGYLKMGWKVVGRPMIWVRPGGRFSLPTRVGPVPIETLEAPDLDEGRIRTSLTGDYLRWRYAEAPTLGYRAYGSGSKGVIVRERTRFGRAELTVSQVVTSRSGIVGCARALRRAVRDSRSFHALGLAAPDTREAAVLAMAGFVPVPGRGPVLVMRPVEGMPIPRDPCDLKNWRLQVGDLEVF